MNSSVRQLLMLVSGVLLFILLFSICNPFGHEVQVDLREPQVDVFTQDESPDQVDMLWVVDNSGSMESYQDNLATNFAAFAEKLTSSNSNEMIDFQMAVVNTDLKDAGRFANGQVLTKNEAVSNKSKFVEDFKNLIRVGTNGTSFETQLICMMLSTRNNPSFFRPDAMLVVNIITDEADMSEYFDQAFEQMISQSSDLDPGVSEAKDALQQWKNGDASAYERLIQMVYSPQATAPPEDLRNEPVKEFVKKLKAFKSGKRVMINSIVSPDGVQLKTASELTNGLVADIQGDFSQILVNFGKNISVLASSFALSRKPDAMERMMVYVDGDLAEDGTWSYNAEQQTIEFVEVPEPGAEIEVHYEVFNEYIGH